MAGPISVNYSSLKQASGTLKNLGSELGSDARSIDRASQQLASGWTGVGSAAFKAASKTLANAVMSASVIMSAEATSLNKAREGFRQQDQALASKISTSR